MSAAAKSQRFGVRCGELGTTFKDNGDGTFTVDRYNRPTDNGTPDWKAQRPGPNDPPLLTATVSSLAEAEKVLVNWTGAATIDPDRPL